MVAVTPSRSGLRARDRHPFRVVQRPSGGPPAPGLEGLRRRDVQAGVLVSQSLAYRRHEVWPVVDVETELADARVLGARLERLAAGRMVLQQPVETVGAEIVDGL